MSRRGRLSDGAAGLNMKKKADEGTRQSYSQKALVYLREQIINGNLPPQEKLVENDIASALGISRGPVRDALKQLAIEGLVDYQPNKGCTVALLSPKDAYEVFFLRGNLEKLALQKGGCHINDQGIFIMETALEEMQALAGTGNTLKEVNADERFHRQIILSGQIDRLIQMWELLSPLNGAMFLTVQATNRKIPGHIRDLASPHRRMLESIRRGDLAAACQALDDHYVRTGENIYRVSLMGDLGDI